MLVFRVDQGRTAKEVFESKLDGSRRPRLRWLEYVEKDLWEIKVMRQQQNAVDREEWVSVITEAKALREMRFRERVSMSLFQIRTCLIYSPLLNRSQMTCRAWVKSHNAHNDGGRQAYRSR